ncbi:PEGA domain-containing protein [Candidatus Sulfurimonas baltica]|uniref:PEGA domain-containing protein n=1 Tax=Candidatus Sulfurimonas baltica TaxID=2740404 RepID=A0A7S7LVB5_9BACT|nr:PEGA domain-containing protein [Candidatus Sulfurimonas baltica]QOY52025.1 PEGA domain-containing protein [Candidatus Sulfurimonas baltica]
MIEKTLVGLALASSMIFASATIISGSNQNVTFNSNPEGATVLIDGVASCSTPCTVSLPKAHAQKNVSFKKDGYEIFTMPMGTSYNGVALLNIIWDFSTTDLITGAAWNYAPNNYYSELKKKD